MLQFDSESSTELEIGGGIVERNVSGARGGFVNIIAIGFWRAVFRIAARFAFVVPIANGFDNLTAIATANAIAARFAVFALAANVLVPMG